MNPRLKELVKNIKASATKFTAAVTESVESFNSKECESERNDMHYQCRGSYDHFGLLGNGKCMDFQQEYYQCKDRSRLKKGN